MLAKQLEEPDSVLNGLEPQHLQYAVSRRRPVGLLVLLLQRLVDLGDCVTNYGLR